MVRIAMSNLVRNYKDLIVWQKAMDLVIDCYDSSRCFPTYEKFGLSSQLQRSAVSVPANIAEGQGRQHTAEFLNYLSIAYGSLMEVETHIQIAARLGYIEESRCENLLRQTSEIGRLLNGLMRSLRTPKTNV